TGALVPFETESPVIRDMPASPCRGESGTTSAVRCRRRLPRSARVGSGTGSTGADASVPHRGRPLTFRLDDPHGASAGRAPEAARRTGGGGTDGLAAAASGRVRLLVVEGPAGMGKTRLLNAARTAGAAKGLRVLTGRASPLEREFGFGIVRDLL